MTFKSFPVFAIKNAALNVLCMCLNQNFKNVYWQIPKSKIARTNINL